MMKIGFFDSGIGGASILKAIQAKHPSWMFTYIADSAHCPYGSKTEEQIRERSFSITKQLIEKGCNVIVVACNTATMNAIHMLRIKHPTIEFIGVEPAIKLAADTVPQGDILLLGTDVSIHDKRIDDLITQFAPDRNVLKRSGSKLVEFVERGDLESEDLRQTIHECVGDVAGITAIILGCTHFIWLKPILQELLRVELVEPTDAMYRRLLQMIQDTPVQAGTTEWITTGDQDVFERQLTALGLAS